MNSPHQWRDPAIFQIFFPHQFNRHHVSQSHLTINQSHLTANQSHLTANKSHLTASIDNTHTWIGNAYQNIYASWLWCAKYKEFLSLWIEGCLRFSFICFQVYTLFLHCLLCQVLYWTRTVDTSRCASAIE